MVNILSAKDIPLFLYPFLQLHRLAECQVSQILNLKNFLGKDWNNIEYSGPHLY